MSDKTKTKELVKELGACVKTHKGENSKTYGEMQIALTYLQWLSQEVQFNI